MHYININNKKYRIQARVGDVNRLVMKYKNEIDELWKKARKPEEKLNDQKISQFIIEMVWLFIQPRFLIKPFIFFKRFSRLIDYSELNKASEVAFLLLHGVNPDDFHKATEDREKGN